MKRNLFSKILNFLGLTIAFTAFMVIAVQIKWDMTFNESFPDKDRTYRVETTAMTQDGNHGCTMCRPLNNMLKDLADIEAIGEFCASASGGAYAFKSEEPDAPKLKAMVVPTASNLLDLMNLELVQGTYGQIDTVDAIVISEKLANSTFPDGDALGKKLIVSGKSSEIIGIFKNMPENSYVRADIFSPMQNIAALDNWGEFSFDLFVKLMPGADSKSVETKIKDLLFPVMQEKMDVTSLDVRLVRVDKIYFSNDTQYDSCPKGNMATDITLITIAFLILLSALINFLNISMAEVPAQIKGINVRKILGESRKSIVFKRLLSAMFLSCCSMVVAIILLQVLSKSSLAEYVSDSIAPANHIMLIAAVLVLALIVSLIAGLYPALYSTSFQPAMVVKGGFAHTTKGRLLRNLLVGLQFSISMVLIIFSLFIQVQIHYMKGYDMGFTSKNVLGFYLPKNLPSNGELLKEKLLTHPEITDVTFADSQIAQPHGMNMSWGRTYKGENIVYNIVPVAYNYIDFFELEMAEGRVFTKDDNQKNGVYIFNEKAAKQFDIKVGENMNGYNGDAEVAGIVKNFNFMPLQYKINAIALYNFGTTPWRDLAYCYVKKTDAASFSTISNIIMEEMQAVDPNVKPDDNTIQFLDDTIGTMYQKEARLARLILIACIISVLISIVGVLGLIHFETQFRKREIGIRRVMGSDISGILNLLNKVYVKLCIICIAIASPMAYIVIKRWLQQYNYQSSIPIWIFAVAFVVVLMIVVGTVSFMSYKSASSNPVESIKSE